MQVLKFTKKESPYFDACALTIGTFDGIHKGHQSVIKELIAKSKEYHIPSVLITFDPHPRLVLDRDHDNASLILTLDEKIEILENLGLDFLVIIPFTLDFAQLHPADYLENYIIKYFNPKAIISGEDHRFGANAAGNNGVFASFAEQYNYEYIESKSLETHDAKISSTLIRTLIQKNDFNTVRSLLGYTYFFTGKVTNGNKLGRQMGYPTANLEFASKHKLLPNDGIYSAIAVVDGREYQAMLYFGNRPTIADNLNRSCEVHLFDFNQDLYSQQVQVRVIEFLREDRKLESIEALQEQIKEDEERTKNSLLRFSMHAHFEKINPSTAVVILNYNGVKHLQKYLLSVEKYNTTNATIYIIDNASTDDSVLYLKRNFPDIELIELKKNYGFAEGYNKGLALIEADYYILLNSDVEIKSAWIQPLVDNIRDDNSIAAVQPKIKSLLDPQKFEYAGAAGGLIDILGFPFCYGRMLLNIEDDKGQYESSKEIFWASGAAFLVNAKLFHAIGGFDRDYFAHQEEIDLCWRLKRAGFKIMYEPKSEVYHLGGGTLDYESPKKTYLNFRNNLITLFKNVPWIYLPILLIIRLIVDSVILILWILQGKWSNSTKILKAYFVNILRTPFLLAKKYDTDIYIENCSRGEANLKGVFRSSILFQKYIFNHSKSSDLPQEYFN